MSDTFLDEFYGGDIYKAVEAVNANTRLTGHDSDCCGGSHSICACCGGSPDITILPWSDIDGDGHGPFTLCRACIHPVELDELERSAALVHLYRMPGPRFIGPEPEGITDEDIPF